MSEWWRRSAREAVAALRAEEISPLDLIEASLERIGQVDGAINALPTLCAERARDQASRLMALPMEERGRLAGLPIAIKDLNDVSGVRTTYGSPLFADHVPERSDIVVERLERDGGVVIAKSNTPEFGAGGNTFNDVLGTTRNPWNLAMTPGGSSGGAAAALAAGEVWLAHGGDLGGSLRTPATFSGVVGLRPSFGRVPRGKGTGGFNQLSVNGPMARDVLDLALFLDAMCGFDPRDPISVPAPEEPYLLEVERALTAGALNGLRVAATEDLGGLVPVHPHLRQAVRDLAGIVPKIGGEVTEASPDFSDAQDIFQTLRAIAYVSDRGPLIEANRDSFKPDIIWNYEQGLALTAADVARAERGRATLFNRIAAFFEDHDVLVCPGTIVPPFPAEERWVREVEGRSFDNYVDWMMVTYALTVTGCPVLSLPTGLSPDGLPVGVQIMGPPKDEARVLVVGALLEAHLDFAARLPIDPRSPN